MLGEITLQLGLRPTYCDTLSAAKALLGSQRYSIVFCDDVLRDGDFHGVIQATSRSGDPIPVIVISERGDDWDSYLKVMKAGAFDYGLFPPGVGEIERIVNAAILNSRRRPRGAGAAA